MSVTTACKDISELTPNAQKACKMFLTECESQGLKVRITETYRSQERQNYLYGQGRTRKGNVVTWTKHSRHTSRRAWDICKNVKGQEYSDKQFFAKCGKIAKSLNITWGGTWKQADTPHFEISENWNINKENDEMTQEEKTKFNKLVDEVNDLKSQMNHINSKMIYNYIDKNMPDWATPTIKKLVDNGYLNGDENGLNLTDEMLRIFVVLDRAGILDK